jgi:hypothetical protein
MNTFQVLLIAKILSLHFDFCFLLIVLVCVNFDIHCLFTDKFDFQLTLIIIVIALVIIYLYFQVYLNFQIAWPFYYLRFSKFLPGFLEILSLFNSFFTFQFPSFFSLNQAFPAFSLSRFQAC